MALLVLNLLEALVLSAIAMTVLWAITEYLKNSSLVDAAWSLCIVLLAFHFFAHPRGFWIRNILGASLVFIWGIRLSLFIFWRNHGKGEDPRYTALREKWGERQKIKMLSFFWAQGAVAAFFCLPFILISLNKNSFISPLEWGAAFLVLLAVGGETAADLSLAHHKADASNRGKTCRAGLWKYSRHPNYFFEWLCWCAFALLASASPPGWLAWCCPALMLHFLLKVSGIPMTEAQALKSRGDDYRDYQRTTSMFVPWIPRK